MSMARVVELFYISMRAGAHLRALDAAMPDRRLTNPVGDFGFPGREIAFFHGASFINAAEMSGVR